MTAEADDATASLPDPERQQRRDTGADRARFVPGARLAGRYRIVGRLGSGGMGEVYRADDLQLGEAVALKFLSAEIAGDPAWLARLRDEVRLARRVTHPNVCRVHDLAEGDGEHFIAMEFVDGEDLASLLRRIGRVPDDKAIDIARQLSLGLAAAHEQGVLHRDLKPANVMLDGRGNVRITDFGVAALAERAGDAERAGTPDYMAPEQLAGGVATLRTDVYALGLVLHEIFTGAAAIRGDALAARADLDPAVERVILRCLDADPQRRPPSALAVAAALPGGDPLAAVLAAGETPSPALVAASGARDVMRGSVAIALVAMIAIAFAVTLPLKSRRALYGNVPLDKPPAALTDRAQEVLARAGYDGEPRETAAGYGYVWYYLRWSDDLPDAPPLRSRLDRARPSTMMFWYRQSPSRFEPRRTSWHPRGRVAALDPRWSVPGEAYVSLDLAGRLRRFYVVPGFRYAVDEEATSFDWRPIFDLAGLDIDGFQPVTPRYTASFRVDERAAWTGVYPEDPDIPLRVEAGVVNGRPSYFRFVSPWDEPILLAAAADAEPDAASEPGLIDSMILAMRTGLVAGLIGIALIVVATVLAYRNRRLGRSDRRGAARLAMYTFAASLVTIVIGSPRFAMLDVDDIARVLGPPTFLAAMIWVCYLGLEPYARRNRPTMMIAWTRLLSGNFRDPLIGRSVLVGALLGIVGTLVFTLAWVLYVWAGGPPPWLPEGGFDRVMSIRVPFSDGLLVMPVLLGFVYLLLVVALRFVLKVRWLTGLAFVLIAPLLFLDTRSIDLMPWSYAAGILWAGLILWLLMRFGVLSVVICVFVDGVLWMSPLTPDPASWMAPVTIAAGLTLAALVAAGTWMAVRTPRAALP